MQPSQSGTPARAVSRFWLNHQLFAYTLTTTPLRAVRNSNMNNNRITLISGWDYHALLTVHHLFKCTILLIYLNSGIGPSAERERERRYTFTPMKNDPCWEYLFLCHVSTEARCMCMFLANELYSCTENDDWWRLCLCASIKLSPLWTDLFCILYYASVLWCVSACERTSQHTCICAALFAHHNTTQWSWNVRNNRTKKWILNCCQFKDYTEWVWLNDQWR